MAIKQRQQVQYILGQYRGVRLKTITVLERLNDLGITAADANRLVLEAARFAA